MNHWRSRNRRIGGLALALALWAPSLFAGVDPVPGQPEITFEKYAVVAANLVPGDAVVWFAVERRVDPDFSADILPRYQVTTAEPDGTSRLELGREVEQRGIWVVVDLQAGGYAAASPEGYDLVKLTESMTNVATRGETESDAILDSRSYLFGLSVRPGEGAWTFGGGDGGPSDEDQESNGTLSFALSALSALPGSPAASPAKLGSGDLWFVIDPLKMELSVLRGGIAE